MRSRLMFLAMVSIAIAFCVPAHAQTNQQAFSNGVDYFFGNTVVPPTNTTTFTRTTPAHDPNTGNRSGGVEGSIHPIGVQQDGFQGWNGQAGVTPSVAQPLGFSLMQFRRGGNFSQATGTVVASAAWATSLPCNAPWFWIVTFTWGTTYTQTSTVLGSNQKFSFSMRGETNQTIGNQNYWTGSGNERNLNSGGISFLEDTIANSAFQLIGAQEWSHSWFTVDATTQTNRDPSGSTSGSFGFDTGTVGTGGTIIRSSNSLLNPGAPADASAIRHEANQQLTGTSNTVLSLIAAGNLGGGLTENASGTFVLPAGDGRRTNLVSDPVLTGLGLSLSIVLTTGGGLGGLTGDVGLSGSAQTIPLDNAAVQVPPALQPLTVFTQAIGIQLPAFSFITSGDCWMVN
ncbi:MAG: hypothetical protein RL885_17445 [Planctomycetota bacterium]